MEFTKETYIAKLKTRLQIACIKLDSELEAGECSKEFTAYSAGKIAVLEALIRELEAEE